MRSALQIVGILNTTPDSYYDGGRFNAVESAVKRAGELLEEGADIIEIGGESTGPGSRDVTLEEERARTVGVIKAVRKEYSHAQVSIDTYKAAIAAEAIGAGVMMVNDVTAGRGDLSMFSVIAKSGVQYVLMYAKDNSPRTTVRETQYDDVVATVKKFLSGRKEAAVRAGIAEDHIILDPGMGHFVSSDPKYSYEILRRLSELCDLGSPLLVSPSRKSFLAGGENLPAGERLPGTVAASAIATLDGATYIRTHDVLPVRRACEVAQRIGSYTVSR